MILIPWYILKRKLLGFKEYKGTDREICTQVIENCYNGKYFQTSNGHFKDFYIRDFSWCVKPLIKLGYQKEVKNTLQWALKQYQENNTVTTTITPSGKPLNMFYPSADSLPSLIKSLQILNDKDLIKENLDFLKRQAEEYVKLIDLDTGLVKENLTLSSIKDHYKRKSCVYDNVHVALLSKQLKQLGIENPLSQYNYKKILNDTFWNGSYFQEDKESKRISSDANIFPYYLEIFQEKSMLKKSLEVIHQERLDHPFPLKYTKVRNKRQELFIARFIPNYEGNSIWMHLGLLYLTLLNKIDKEKTRYHLEQYKTLIETHQNFLELFHPNGKPFSTVLYKTDEAMLWAAMYLDLHNHFNKKVETQV